MLIVNVIDLKAECCDSLLLLWVVVRERGLWHVYTFINIALTRHDSHCRSFICACFYLLSVYKSLLNSCVSSMFLFAGFQSRIGHIAAHNDWYQSIHTSNKYFVQNNCAIFIYPWFMSVALVSMPCQAIASSFNKQLHTFFFYLSSFFC